MSTKPTTAITNCNRGRETQPTSVGTNDNNTAIIHVPINQSKWRVYWTSLLPPSGRDVSFGIHRQNPRNPYPPTPYYYYCLQISLVFETHTLYLSLSFSLPSLLLFLLAAALSLLFDVYMKILEVCVNVNGG